MNAMQMINSNTSEANHSAKLRRVGAVCVAAMLVLGTIGMSGCGGSDAQSGALLGAGIGAIGGAVIGHNSGRRTAEGAAIGAGIGAVGGYMMGNESDKARQRHYYRHY